MKVTINDIVQHSGLSYVTVSKAIRNHPSVKSENRRKVMETMKALGYVPNAAAKSLVTGRTYVIAIIISELGDGFYDSIIEAVNKALLKRGYLLTLTICKDDEQDNITFLQQKRVDGVIIMAPLKEKFFADILKDQKVPYIIIDNQTEGYDCPAIICDNQDGGRQAAEHLLKMGCSTIGLIGGDEQSISTIDRYKGAIKALENRIEDNSYICYGKYDQLTGYKAVMDWHKRGKLPEGIFGFDDHIAMGAINALKDLGIKVPEDVKVCGFDDSLLAKHYSPNITSVKQPAEKMAQIAVDQLISEIEDEVKPERSTILLPGLEIRESTI